MGHRPAIFRPKALEEALEDEEENEEDLVGRIRVVDRGVVASKICPTGGWQV